MTHSTCCRRKKHLPANRKSIKRSSFSKTVKAHRAKKRRSPPLSTSSLENLKPRGPLVWETIVLHYISKLKNTWQASQPSKKMSGSDNDWEHHPTPGQNPTACTKFQDTNTKSKDISKTDHYDYNDVDQDAEKRSHYYSSMQKISQNKPPPDAAPENGFAIVSEVVNYGLASGILKKKGQYFAFGRTFAGATKTKDRTTASKLKYRKKRTGKGRTLRKRTYKDKQRLAKKKKIPKTRARRKPEGNHMSRRITPKKKYLRYRGGKSNR